MALPAARRNDLQACDKHGPAPLPDGQLDVKINSQPTVRVGDAFPCGGCPNRVKTGASTFTIGGEFAARLTDKSDHEGWIVVGSTNVVVGGPTGMGTIGAGKSACRAMAAGRKSLHGHQSYGNCMPESLRQIIRRAKGNNATEDEVMGRAFAQGAFSNPGHGNHGATSAYAGVRVLNDFDIPAETVPASGAPSLQDIQQAIAERKGVVATFQTPGIWPPQFLPATHAALVTGVELDDQGNVVAVFLNDTGLGECGRRVPADKFLAGMNACRGAHPLVVTKGAIW